MKKYLFLLTLGLISAGQNAEAAWFSLPPETKALTENLTECQPFEYKGQAVYDIKLNISGRENEDCAITCDLVELEDAGKKYHFSCLLSDFNIEEVKLAFEQATVNVSNFKRNKDGRVIMELFEGFTKNNICKLTK